MSTAELMRERAGERKKYASIRFSRVESPEEFVASHTFFGDGVSYHVVLDLKKVL